MRVRIAQHSERHLWLRALKEIHVHGRARRRFWPVFVDIADDANDGERSEVAIDVSEFNGVADGVLIGPALTRQGYADDRNVRRIGAITLVKHSSLQERNSEGLKISVTGDAKIRFPESLFLSEENVEIVRQLLQRGGIL